VTIENAAESKITSINALTDNDISPVPSESSYPAVVYNPPNQNVSTLDIQIVNTSDNSIPSKVQLGIFGCAEPPQVITRAAPEERTRATSASCKIPFSKKEMSY
jgi:hypothetical protein